MGTLPPGLTAHGRVAVGGREGDAAAARERRALWGRTLTLLPQEPWLALDPTRRAAPQVAEGYRWVRGAGAAEAKRRALDDLKALGLGGAAHALPSQLSGGMAQRVAFAAARAGGARIVLADEPTKGLDAARRDDVVALLKREADAGGGLLTITHDVEVARRLGGQLAVMLGGEIVERGPAERVLRVPEHDYTRRLLAAEPSAWPRTGGGRGAGAPVLRAEGLSKTRGGRTRFDGLNVTAAPGEFVGLSGPSGGGKSTLGDLLLGLLTPDAGTVWRDPAAHRVRFQKLYQDPPAAFSPHVSLHTSLSDLVKRHRLDAKQIDPTMARLGLEPALLGRRPREISGGELQRFALLRTLLLEPVFLFADEPTSRLDLITQQETVSLLSEVARERGCAVLLVSHDLELIRKVSDRWLELGAPQASPDEGQPIPLTPSY
jgi:peptide/nickel transport system ATP-binding protein